MITTKATWLGSEYGCRVFRNGLLVVEARCPSKDLIGPTFRTLLSTLDTLGGDVFTSAARKRRYRPGNVVYETQHYWSRRT